MNVKDLQIVLGVDPDGNFGSKSKKALFSQFANPNAPKFADSDIADAAHSLGVSEGHIRASILCESPRGSFDAQGKPVILFERHKFAAATTPPNRFNLSNPDLSGGPYGPGGYGPLGKQWDKLAAACALDPEAAFEACSWGAFQVMGGNAKLLGYASAFDMALTLVSGEKAHLETYVRFIKAFGLVERLRACRAGDSDSCVPFVRRYNGPDYEKFDYHRKFAAAIA